MLSRDQLVEIVGRLDDLKLAEIIGSGASAAQVTLAKTWIALGDEAIHVMGANPDPVVVRVHDLLRADEPEWDDA
jgi:hypothetical protein